MLILKNNPLKTKTHTAMESTLWFLVKTAIAYMPMNIESFSFSIPHVMSAFVFVLVVVAGVRFLLKSIKEVYHVVVYMAMCGILSALMTGWCLTNTSKCISFYADFEKSIVYMGKVISLLQNISDTTMDD